MALTPKDFLDISEDIESIYQRTVDELLINIARHFNINGWERTRYWEIKKLAEMGALTEESVKIIARDTNQTEEEVRKAFLQVSEKACLDIDPELKGAAKEGLLQDPGTTPSTSVLMRDMVQAFVDQAVDKLNMTNQTMLESTRQAYLRGVTTVANEMQLAEAKLILEAESLEVTLGQETFPRAVRKAMNQLAATGLTGFVDSAGRTWQPEAYAAMVIRTTSHNAAVQSIKTRQAEFGAGDVFQISSHTGARPLCAPYQGNVYSWGNSSGVIHDGDGREIHYDPISSTSYGQAAGIFGVNCGHHPIPLVDGYSYLQDKIDQTPEENAKEYAESQKQRALERSVRAAKRELEIATATGDKEGAAEASKRVRAAQKAVRDYVAETGRVRRYDREQVGPAAPGGGPPPTPPTPEPIAKLKP